MFMALRHLKNASLLLCALAVVELVVLAVSSPGPFSFLVAFELPGSSEYIDSHLSLPYVQESWPLPAAVRAFKAHRVCMFSR